MSILSPTTSALNTNASNPCPCPMFGSRLQSTVTVCTVWCSNIHRISIRWASNVYFHCEFFSPSLLYFIRARARHAIELLATDTRSTDISLRSSDVIVTSMLLRAHSHTFRPSSLICLRDTTYNGATSSHRHRTLYFIYLRVDIVHENAARANIAVLHYYAAAVRHSPSHILWAFSNTDANDVQAHATHTCGGCCSDTFQLSGNNNRRELWPSDSNQYIYGVDDS